MEIQTNHILTNIARHVALNKNEIDYFTSLLKAVNLKKHEYLLKAGELCNTINYLNVGALRAFYRDHDEKEATIMFAVDDWWITDMPCFVSGKPAMISIQAIHETSVIQLTKPDMELLYERVPKFERYFRILMQNAYVREQLRILQNLSLPAETRYANFLEKYPGIARQVTLKNIASYLGITPEFLSNIRSKLSKGPIS
jgi:CRP-like cAMP-binding protein